MKTVLVIDDQRIATKVVGDCMKFLIVDDDKDLLEVLSMIVVSNYNVDIVEANNGQNAIDKIKNQGPFDLVICDYNMPEKNGADVFKELRKENQATPFLLISTDIDKFKHQIPEATNCEFIKKPFTEKELVYKVLTAINQCN